MSLLYQIEPHSTHAPNVRLQQSKRVLTRGANSSQTPLSSQCNIFAKRTARRPMRRY